MIVRSTVASLFVLIGNAVLFAAEPTVEEVRLNPKKFAGQTVSLDKVKLFGGINHDANGPAWVHIVSAAGKVDFAIGKGPRFTLSKSLTEELTKATANGFKIDSKLQAICSVKGDGTDFVFVITKMKFYNKNDTTVLRVFGD